MEEEYHSSIHLWDCNVVPQGETVMSLTSKKPKGSHFFLVKPAGCGVFPLHKKDLSSVLTKGR